MKLLFNVYSLKRQDHPVYAYCDADVGFLDTVKTGNKYIEKMKNAGLWIDEIHVAADDVMLFGRFDNDDQYYNDYDFNCRGYMILPDNFVLPEDVNDGRGLVDLVITENHGIQFEAWIAGNRLLTMLWDEVDYAPLLCNDEEEDSL